MVQLISISKTYNKEKKNSVKAIDDINLSIADGEMIAITGASGAGKSTLMNILACVQGYDTGKYLLNEKDVSEFSDRQLSKIRNKHIGTVFQNFMLLNENTVLENVEIPLLFSKIRKKQRLKMCRYALMTVGMESFEKHIVNELSGGQKQRVAIARAIVNMPEIILADEPTGSLDTTNGENIIECFKEINSEKKTVIIITHNEEIAKQCPRIIKMSDGKITEDYRL